MRQLLIVGLTALFVAVRVSIALAEVDPIEESLTAAKAKYESELESAQAGVLDTLTTRAESEQAYGNLDPIEITHAEIAALIGLESFTEIKVMCC